MPTAPEPSIVPGRSCEGCTMCCKLLSIEELQKPEQVWCASCDVGKGCRIYADRPGECRNFYCGWLVDPGLGDAWRPRDSRMVFKFEARRILLVVDKARRDSWRKEPFLSHLRVLARMGLAHRGDVVVTDGVDSFVILPDGERKL